MTNAQKWVFLFFALFIVFLAITYISNKEDDSSTNISDAQLVAESTIKGETIYKEAGCASCHGENLLGTKNGPSIVKLSESWSKKELVNFLRNPDEFSNDKRILQVKGKFGNSFMPSFNTIDAQKLGKLAEYLLSK